MKMNYFKDTDTLHIEFNDMEIVESKDLDENVVVDLDFDGKICAITIEHISDTIGKGGHNSGESH